MKSAINIKIAGALTMLLTASAAIAQRGEIVIDGSTTVGPVSKAFAEYFMEVNEGINVTVSESGSGNGIRSLINGDCHIAQASRFMSVGEYQAALENGVRPVTHVIGLDGLAPVVHPANPVSDLTLDQIRDIYAGKIRNWNEVGGPDMRIIKVSRDTNSGTYGVWRDVVMRGEDISGDTEYVGSNGAIRSRVQSTRGAIGYIGLGFVDRTVKAVNVDGVEPNAQSTASGRYPIARPLYLFTNGYPELGSALHRFMTIHFTEVGHSLIEGVGFVPQTQY